MMNFDMAATGLGQGGNPLMTVLIAVFTVLLIGGIGRAVYVWIRNNRSPVQTMNARVVAKRMKVSGHGMHTAGYNPSMRTMGSPTYTRYFATFEMDDNGRRLELNVNDSEYGMLAENDRGRLSFQGTRYLGFERA